MSLQARISVARTTLPGIRLPINSSVVKVSGR
jgi:hypothetical protein